MCSPSWRHSPGVKGHGGRELAGTGMRSQVEMGLGLGQAGGDQASKICRY